MSNFPISKKDIIPAHGFRPSRRHLLLAGGAAAISAASVLPGLGLQRSWAQGKADLELKFGHPYNIKHPLAQGAEKFAELVGERTSGHVKVNVYPNSTIGSSQQLVNGMQMGAVDVALVPTTDVATFFSPLDVFYLPFIFSGSAQAYRVSDGPIGERLYEEMNKQIGIRTLAMYESGFRTITTRRTAVRVPDDLKGLKIRVPNSPMNIATFKALGTNPTPLALSEVFTALQQGTVDGQDNPIGNVYAFGFYKVQDYETLSNHQWAGIMFLMSDGSWQRLPQDVQDIVRAAAIESRDWERKTLAAKDEEYLEIMQKEGLQVIRLTDEEHQQFQERTKSVWDEFGADLSQELVDSVKNA